LTSRAEIQALFERGQRIDRPTLLLLWSAGAGGRRAAFAVSRQIRGAVGRNRARRRLREAYRRVREAAPLGAAMVVVAKRAALDVAFHRLERDLAEALGAIPR
jgi:ribonuclease P protein component